MLRKFVKALAVLALVLVAGAIVLAVYVSRTWDRVWDVPLPDLHASADPAVIARGEYLVYGPAHCVACHAGSESGAAAAVGRGERVPLIGGQEFAAPPLGAIYSRNLTPDPETGIGRYSDGQIARLLRWSVLPDGRSTLQSLMTFGGMSDDDLVAILSFLRAQPPVRNVVPPDRYTAIGKIVRSVFSSFKPREHVEAPAVAPVSAPTRERGEYLARSVGNCSGCHTRRSDVSFEPIAPEFSGGVEMSPIKGDGIDPDIWFRTPNLTPAKGSKLNDFPDRETFVARFRRGGRQKAGSPMPWEMYGRLTEEDAGALYEFFRSLPPSPGPTGDAEFRKVK